MDGKTGQRLIPLFEPRAAKLLNEWLEAYPKNHDGRAWLWLDDNNHQLAYAAFVRRLNKLVQKSGFNKQFNPHWWRHSAYNQLSKTLSDQQAKYYFGWTPSSRMPSVYGHPDLALVQEAFEKLYPSTSEEDADASIAKGVAFFKKMLSHREVMDTWIQQAKEFGHIHELRELVLQDFYKNGDAPNGIRTRVKGLRSLYPWPG